MFEENQEIRKNIDVMESLAELEPEIRVVDLLDAIAAIQLNEKVWTVMIESTNWERIKRSAENHAGYRLFRENEISSWHHDPSDTALESFRIHSQQKSPITQLSTPASA